MATTLAEELKAEGIQKGILEGKAEAVITVLKARFGTVSADIRKAVKSHSGPLALESLTIHAATCNSLKEFRKRLQ